VCGAPSINSVPVPGTSEPDMPPGVAACVAISSSAYPTWSTGPAWRQPTRAVLPCRLKPALRRATLQPSFTYKIIEFGRLLVRQIVNTSWLMGKRLKRTHPSTLLSATPAVVIAALLLCSCGRQATKPPAVSSGAPLKSSPAQPSDDDERRKENDDLKAKLRQQYPNWSEQQISDYVQGYNGFGISPETYAKTRAVLDSARSLRCQFPRGSYVDLADPGLARHESAGAEVTFDAIDRQRGHARIIAKSGAGDVTVITGPTALTFVEVAPTGNPLVTVVFPRFLAGTREFYGQYYGSCTVLE
jgi:hypothetical protein